MNYHSSPFAFSLYRVGSGLRRFAVALAVAYLAPQLSFAQSTVPDFGPGATVQQCITQAQNLAPAVGGPRVVQVVELLENTNGRFNSLPIIGQFPEVGAELTDGHLMHVAVTPLNDPWADCKIWIIIAIIEFIIILILIFRCCRSHG